jgi:hypothetical protein
MRRKPATYALLRLHAELTSPLDRWHVEAVIQLLEPGFKMRPLGRRKPNPWFKQGTLARLALEVLSAAGRALTSREITLALLAQRGIIGADPKAVRDLIDSVDSALRYHKGRTVIAVGGGSPVHWMPR